MNKSILIIPGYRLFPCETGAGIAQFGMIDSLRKTMEITILIDANNVEQKEVEKLKNTWPDVNVLFWPEIKAEWESSYSPSLVQRIKSKFSSESPKPLTPETQIPESLNEVWRNVSILFSEAASWRKASLYFHLKSHSYTIVQTDLPVNLPLIQVKISHTKTVHVCHELKHRRFENTALSCGVSDTEFRQAYNEIREKENALITAYDQCICFSEEDVAALQDIKKTEICLSPFPVLDNQFFTGKRGAPERLIFLGPENHGPNREGLQWFLEEIFPAINEKWKIHVIGNWSEETKILWQSERILFEGFVADLQAFYADGVMVVPIRTGAGIRTKILEAMAQQVPVFSAPFGAEGIPYEEGVHLHLFKTANEFNEQLNKLDVEHLVELRMAAQNLVRENFSQEILGKKRYLLLNK